MSIASEQYAAVVFELASERESVEDVHRDLGWLQTMLDEVGEFRSVWLHPVLSSEVKKKILGPVVQPAISPLSWDFVQLLMDRSREALFTDIRQGYGTLMQQAQGITQVQIHTAYALDDQQREAIQQALAQQYGQVDLEEHQDPSLLAGVVVRIGDMKIDGSLRRRLDALEAVLSEGGA